MSTTDDSIELPDLEEEEEEAPVVPAVETEGDLTPEQKQIAELTAKVAALGASKSDDKMSELLELGKQFLAGQNKPKEAAPVDNTAFQRDFGERLTKAVLNGNDPAEVARIFAEGADGITKARMQELITQFGNPMADKAGTFALDAYLKRKGEEMSESGKPTHNLVAKKFELNEQERMWLATAKPQDAVGFLDGRYRQIAGDLLLDSAKKAKPKNLAGGSGGGPRSTSSVASFPGLTDRQMRQQEKLAEMFWPDPKVREQKLKELATMNAGEAS